MADAGIVAGSLRFQEYAERIYSRSIGLGIPSIEPSDGLALYTATLLAVSRVEEGEVVALDAGAGIGYSTLWIAKAVDDGCRVRRCTVYAVEAVDVFASEARRVLAGYPWGRTRIHVVQGDAVEAAERLPSPLTAFVDIDKHLYKAMLEALWPRIPVGGFIAFHNAYTPPPPREFYEAIERLSNAVTSIAPTSAGLLLAVKTSER